MRLLGVAASLVLAYTLWADVAPRLLRSPTTTRESHWGIMDVRWLGDVLPRHLDTPKARVIDPGRAPNEALSEIRRELEMGNLSETAWRLRELAPSQPGEVGAQKFLVAMWNNLGVQQNSVRGPDIAVEAFRRAVALDPANPVANLNLAHAYWEIHAPALTREFLDRVIRLNPGEPFPRIVMAELLIGAGDQEAAARHLAAAMERAVVDPTLRAYAERLAVKIRRSGLSVVSSRSSVDLKETATSREPVVETNRTGATVIRARVIPPSVPQGATANDMVESPAEPSPETGQDHFVVKFVGTEDRETWERVRAVLEYAYREIGGKFGQYPSAPISVVLHPDEQFLDLTGTPKWADMLFDSASGEIHLPLQGALNDLARLSRVIRHEFVHALLQDRIGSNIGELPTWIVEGLAMQLAEDPWPDVEEANQAALVLMPLGRLDGPWSRLSKESLPGAYLEAQLATRTLLDRYTLTKVRQLLTSRGDGKNLHAAMRARFPLTDDMVQAQWKERLGVRKASAGS
jgi:hypothetical protein